MTEDWPPLNYKKDGELKGPAVDIVKEIQKIVGSSEAIDVLPWKRAYNMTQNKSHTALFAITRTEAKENIFKWVGPIAEKRYSLYAKKDSTIEVKDLADAVGLSVSVQRGGATEDQAKKFGFTNLNPSSKGEQSQQKGLYPSK